MNPALLEEVKGITEEIKNDSVVLLSDGSMAIIKSSWYSNNIWYYSCWDFNHQRETVISKDVIKEVLGMYATKED